MSADRALRALALTNTISIYGLIILGAYVTHSGAGLACPDWPTCHGQIVPDFSIPGVAVEYAHRLWALAAGLIMLGLLVLVLSRYRRERTLVSRAASIVALTALQVLVGERTVSLRLNPVVATLHTALAVAIFGLATMTALHAFQVAKAQGVPAAAQPVPLTSDAPDPSEGRPQDRGP